MASIPDFSKYVSVGVLNTTIHWVVFGIVYQFNETQTVSNMAGFMFAVTSSFFLNAKWTFKARATHRRYATMVAFMAALSWIIGYLADLTHMHPVLTLIFFSGMSLILGFFFSKHFVFSD